MKNSSDGARCVFLLDNSCIFGVHREQQKDNMCIAASERNTATCPTSIGISKASTYTQQVLHFMEDADGVVVLLDDSLVGSFVHTCIYRVALPLGS